jgi:hypothetical protein
MEERVFWDLDLDQPGEGKTEMILALHLRLLV